MYDFVSVIVFDESEVWKKLIDSYFSSDALRVNLQRAIILQRVNISMEIQDIQVNYTNETGPSWFDSKQFRYLDHIKRTTVFIDNSGLNTSFSYIKAYGWAPGHSK